MTDDAETATAMEENQPRLMPADDVLGKRLEALLLLGPTGSGKTPLGDYLASGSLWGRRCHHFDFGANLRAIVAGQRSGAFTAEEVSFLRRVLKEGVLLEDKHFPLAARILAAFVTDKDVQPEDLIVLNGLPRHLTQAKAVDRSIKVVGVIELNCSAQTVVERLRKNSGGDRAQRHDDTAALISRKLATYEERTRPLLDHYREQAVQVLRFEVDVGTQPSDIVRRLEEWGNLPISEEPRIGTQDS